MSINTKPWCNLSHRKTVQCVWWAALLHLGSVSQRLFEVRSFLFYVNHIFWFCQLSQRAHNHKLVVSVAYCMNIAEPGSQHLVQCDRTIRVSAAPGQIQSCINGLTFRPTLSVQQSQIVSNSKDWGQHHCKWLFGLGLFLVDNVFDALKIPEYSTFKKKQQTYMVNYVTATQKQ